VPVSDEFSAEQRVAELEQAARRLQRQLAQTKAKTADLIAAVYEAAHDAALVSGTPSPVPAPKPDKRKGGEVALLHMTDTHIGAVTPTFNTDIAHERIRETIAKTVALSEIQRADHPVDECVLMLGGDHIEQTAQFPNQSWAVDGTTFQQIFNAASFIQEAILTLLANFTKVRVFSVPGNHGRVGKGKGRQSVEYESATNWDSILFQICRDQLGQQDRLEWTHSGEWYEIIEIGKYRALLHHGDLIRGFGGNIPAYGILRRHLSWSAGVLPEFRDAYLGHFHTPMTLPLTNGTGRVFVTPSLVSDSAYAKEWVGSASVPAQRLHFIHPERGVTGEFLLWV
jgi:hypothetical protein